MRAPDMFCAQARDPDGIIPEKDGTRLHDHPETVIKVFNSIEEARAWSRSQPPPVTVEKIWDLYK